MQEMIREIETSTNDRFVNDNNFLYQMQKSSYSTATGDNPHQLNERASFTTRINSQQRGLTFTYNLTPDPTPEHDIEQEQEIDIDTEWAKIARISIKHWAKENPY